MKCLSDECFGYGYELELGRGIGWSERTTRDRELLENTDAFAETARGGEKHWRGQASLAIFYTAHKECPTNKNLVISELQVKPHKDADNGPSERGNCIVILSPFKCEA